MGKETASSSSQLEFTWAQNLRAAFLMVLMAAILVINDTLMKFVIADMPIFQSLLIRGIMMTPLVVLILHKRGELRISTSRKDKIIIMIRAICEAGLAYFILAAIAEMPLANVTIILQALPFAMTVAAALYLKERVGWRRWVAVIVGFIGVVIIVQPGTDEFNIYSLFALASVVLFVVRDILVRHLSPHIPSTYTILPLVIAVMVMGGALSPFTGWVEVKALTVWFIFGAGLMITSSYLLAVVIMRSGDVSFVSPFRYSGIIWAIIAGILFFGEWPDGQTLIGAVLITAAGLYSLHRKHIAKPE